MKGRRDSEKGEETEERREETSRKNRGNWVRIGEETDTEARVGPKHGNLEN